MTAPASKLSLLQHIVRNLHVEPLKLGPITENQFQASVRGKIGPSGIAGIRAEAAEALDQLADSAFRNRQYQRVITFAAIVDELSSIIILNYASKAHVTTMQISDVNFIEQKIAEWFQRQIAVHEFFIPCFISPWDACAFSIGPVQFAHLRQFVPAAEGETGVMFEVSFRPAIELMGRAAANWMATVKVEGCTKNRAQEIADLTIDIALGGTSALHSRRQRPAHGADDGTIDARI